MVVRFALIVVSTLSISALGQPFSSITGTVCDVDTKQPVAGVNVVAAGTELGAATDLDGRFVIPAAPVGSYLLEFSHLSYEPLTLADVVVKAGRATNVSVEMRVSAIQGAEVTVRPSLFSRVEKHPTSVTVASYEEIRRASGSAGDVSRIMMALPSVAKVNDTRNNLVVRGGSPMENGYYIDGIPVPNINHFPSQGASGGAVGLVNVDFIRDVRFYAGGFNAAYGDRLSSVMDISFREGSGQGFQGQADLSMLNMGLVGEGPLTQRGSWMASARRSWINLIVESQDVEASTIPVWTDLQGKLSWDAGDRHKLSVIDIAGIDESVIGKDRALDQRENVYGQATWTTNTLGGNWRWLWGASGYANTSLSFAHTRWDGDWYRVVNGDSLASNKSIENVLTLRNVSRYNISRTSGLDFGVEVAQTATAYDNVYAAWFDPLGNPMPELRVDDKLAAFRWGAFGSYDWQPLYGLRTTWGVRFDRSGYSGNGYVSPRWSAAYNLDGSTTVSASYGRFRQFLPLVLVSQQPEFKELVDPSADHVVLGVSRLLSQDTRLTVEAYSKDYQNLPLDPAQPQMCVIDESATQDGFVGHQALVDNGVAYTRGVEAMLQKKLAEKLYGTLSGSYFRSRYQGLDGVWRDRRYDNRYVFALDGGYKLDARWEFSARWIYAGGAPYTPFDMGASTTAGRGIQDSTQVNGERLPPYHSLNLRADRRWNFRATNVILYVALWNVYGRKNLAEYFWNELDNRRDVMEQWGMLTAFGVEFEF